MGLSLVGYTAGLEAQSDATLFGIKAVMFVLPGICAVACFILYKTMWTLKDKKSVSEVEEQAELAEA